MPDRKFGRISPEILPEDDPSVLHFGAFLKPHLRPPPSSVNWAKGNLDYPMNLNDQLGCCGPAASAHQIQTFTANSQVAPTIPTDAQVLEAYQAVSGYDGTPQTDNGVVMKDLFDYWKQVGIGGNKIVAAASVNPLELSRIQWAIVIFGGVQLGVSLPQSALDQTDRGQPWSVVRGSPIVGGHDVAAVGYDQSGFLAVSWGQLVRVTYEFVATMAEEIWTVVDPSWLNEKGLSPNLLNLGSLMTDIGLI